MAHEMKMGDDNILQVKFSGDLDEASLRAYIRDYEPFIQATSASRPLHFLVDVSQVGKIPTGVRRIFNEIFRDPDPRTGYTAIVGANRYVRVMASFVLRATGTPNLRMFDSEDKARAWLKSLDATSTDKEVSP